MRGEIKVEPLGIGECYTEIKQEIDEPKNSPKNVCGENERW